MSPWVAVRRLGIYMYMYIIAKLETVGLILEDNPYTIKSEGTSRQI